MHDSERSLGLTAEGQHARRDRSVVEREIALRLAALGYEMGADTDGYDLRYLTQSIFARARVQARLLGTQLCPVDGRIQAFIDELLADVGEPGTVRLPSSTFILDRHGLARELSLPVDDDMFVSEHVSSYRTSNGVIHNPASDRRTTKGVFHVADRGLPIPADKVPVPPRAFARILRLAMAPPDDLMILPFTATSNKPAREFVSLLLRPVVCPEIPRRAPAKSMEVRFFAPGSLVANLDFVESIFGNAGDPYLPENDSALDVEHWVGHTGCVILAPHVRRATKKQLGLPHKKDATAREQHYGMCWEDENELYNDGNAFKITCRDARGIMVTVICDNYFGYCKKEVKTQISLSANLFGLAEEEHAGGALALASYRLGDEFQPGKTVNRGGHTMADTLATLQGRIDVHPDGYATDKLHPEIYYLPESMSIDLHAQKVKWLHDGKESSMRLLQGRYYVHPSGYKVHLEKHPVAPTWNLIGTMPDGVVCHKPCTVSGGGKSEISKSLWNSVLAGPIYVSDHEKDMKAVAQILERDYADRMRPEFRRDYSQRPARKVLSSERSLGSVIKLLTPSPIDYTDEYNAWLRTIPNHVLAMVYIIKRFYRPEWGDDWQSHFSVDIVNGAAGHELKYHGRKLVGAYLRVGHHANGAWRTFKLRQDFSPSAKVQFEDDITASVVVPNEWLPATPVAPDRHPSVKLTRNCEWRLFQRPDDAVIPGGDTETEREMASPGLFCSNYEPMTPPEVDDLVKDVFVFDRFTPPMAQHLRDAIEHEQKYTVCTAKPRIVDGKPTKNPRYLQVRPDVAAPLSTYLAQVGARMNRRLKPDEPVVFPVEAVLSGRRNNPPEKDVRPLCVYNPLHYQELPELFMDYVCSLTGKSPSTTGAGSEGALTKGPFNAIRPAADLNNTLVSMVLCGYDGYSTAAGWVGPHVRVDHDISLLVPEVWCRLPPEERDAKWLIANGFLEKLTDFEHQGKKVLASRLGYRITEKWVRTFLGRIFDKPEMVFSKEMLKPETQDMDIFVDGMSNIVEAHEWVAKTYFEDGSIDDLCPPLKALLHIMAYGHYEGKGIEDPSFRRLFTREAVLDSDWYRLRLHVRQRHEILMLRSHCAALREFIERPGYEDVVERLNLKRRLEFAEAEQRRVSSADHVRALRGTIGADPFGGIFTA